MLKTILSATLSGLLLSVGVTVTAASTAASGKAGLGEPCKSAADCKGNAICRAPKGKSRPKLCFDPRDKSN